MEVGVRVMIASTSIRARSSPRPFFNSESWIPVRAGKRRNLPVPVPQYPLTRCLLLLHSAAKLKMCFRLFGCMIADVIHVLGHGDRMTSTQSSATDPEDGGTNFSFPDSLHSDISPVLGSSHFICSDLCPGKALVISKSKAYPIPE